MSNLSDLKTLLDTTAATITVTAEKYLCLNAIEAWYNAKVAADAFDSSDVTSYTIGGRSVTKKTTNDVKVTEKRLFAELMQWPEIAALFATRGAGVADLRGTERDFVE